MTVVRCSRPPIARGGLGSCSLPPVYRLVLVLVVLVLVVVLVLRGDRLDEITGSVLVLMTGLAAALDRLMGIQGKPASSPLPTL